tara:strand:- start:385 stop:810 length:426 start_codon:yes stop_codon:yes gene_type:complete
MNYQLAMNLDEVTDYIGEVFPQISHYGFEVEELIPGEITVSMKISSKDLRPGGTVSGPTMFTLADCASYLVILAHIGKVALAVTTNLNINFLNKPAETDLIARAKLLKLGKRLAVCDIELRSRGEEKLVAHATATYSIPPR